MENSVLGLHHITAIAGNAKRNFEFYTNVLGLRLVKKTVNFDDPGTYHFYYGNEIGAPGTILTFFPWEGIGKGRNGSGMATHIGYAVPEGSLAFWKERFLTLKVSHEAVGERFGEQYLRFRDPDGLEIDLIVPAVQDNRIPWKTSEVSEEVAMRGFHGVTLTLKEVAPTATILTDLLGYHLLKQAGNIYRFVNSAVENASVVDVIEAPSMTRGISAAGTNHHVAFRVKDEKTQMEFRERILAKGLNITPKIDRDYFFSVYFREPGGVLFEIATENPGFAVDEPLSELGKNLKLPKQYEGARIQIEKKLPVLN